MWKWLFSWMKLLISKGAYISMNLFIISPYSLGLSPLLSLSVTSCPHANFLCLSLVPPAHFLTPKVNFVILFCLMSSNLGGQRDPNCILRAFLWVVLSRCLRGPKFFFCPPLWKTDWQLVTGRALVLGTHRKPCGRCPESQWRKCGQASTRWGTRCRPIMFHWNPNKAPDSGSFPWDAPVGNWHRFRTSQQLVSPC